MARRARRVTATKDAFWDTSALVPLCTRQPSSTIVSAHYRNYSVSVWWGTSVEIASALAREHRAGNITDSELIAAKAIAHSLEQGWSAIAPTTTVRASAQKLLGIYNLRAADAFQLAAAIEWCEQQTAGRIFLTADDRLREAARLAGFDTSQL